MTIRCDGQTCTCGIGPWDVRGVCDECGGTDLGIPLFLGMGLPHVTVRYLTLRGAERGRDLAFTCHRVPHVVRVRRSDSGLRRWCLEVWL